MIFFWYFVAKFSRPRRVTGTPNCAACGLKKKATQLHKRNSNWTSRLRSNQPTMEIEEIAFSNGTPSPRKSLDTYCPPTVEELEEGIVSSGKIGSLPPTPSRTLAVPDSELEEEFHACPNADVAACEYCKLLNSLIVLHRNFSLR